MQARQDLLVSVRAEHVAVESMLLTISHGRFEISVFQPDLNKTIEFQTLDIASRTRSFGKQFTLKNLISAAQGIWDELQ